MPCALRVRQLTGSILSAVGSAEPPGEASELPDAPPAAGGFTLAALEALYRRQAMGLMRRVAGRVGRDEASDAVQEAFARLLVPASHERPIECPEAFLTTVAANALRDRARSAARRAHLLARLAEGSANLADDPHRLLENREALREVERALERMDGRRRRIFLLHRLEQLTYAEIAARVGMSEKGVKKQMAKALVELRRAVERPQ